MQKTDLLSVLKHRFFSINYIQSRDSHSNIDRENKIISTTEDSKMKKENRNYLKE